MMFEGLAASRSLLVERFKCFDEFQPSELVRQARSLPFSPNAFSSARATVRLTSCRIVLQKTFPRILEVGYETRGALFLIPMNDSVDAMINGVCIDGSFVAVVRGKVSCNIVERGGNLLALIDVPAAVRDYDWSYHSNTIAFLRAGPALGHLQAVIRTLFSLVSSRPEVVCNLEESAALEAVLFDALDQVLATGEHDETNGAPALDRYRVIARKVDDLFSSDPAAAIYSDAVASACGISCRTLHNALRKMRGVSLHRYLLLMRLAAVRQLLLAPVPSTKIAPAAAANGFWHAGEFSAQYKRYFGETPAQTLKSARRHKL